MAGDFAVQPVSSHAVTSSVLAHAPAQVAAPSYEAASAASKRPLVNPSLHVDLALNLVVLQFVDDKGDVTNSIPSEKQLKAYRDHASQANRPAATSQ